jgi:hypothetical protein
VAANNHLFALLDQIQQAGELCLRFIDADLDSLTFILVKNSDQEQAVRLGLHELRIADWETLQVTWISLFRQEVECGGDSKGSF